MGEGSFAAGVYAMVVGLSGFHAYAVIIAVLFACGLGLPVPEDITLFAAGFLAFKGRISLFGAFAVGMIGVLVGDSFMYWIGRIYGRKVLTWPVFRKILTAERIEKAEGRIQRNAKKICFTARFAPGLRAPIYLTSGILGIPFPVFFLMDAFAAIISVPVWVTLAYFLGDKIEQLFEIAKTAKLGLGVVVICAILGFLIFRLRKKLQEKRMLGDKPS